MDKSHVSMEQHRCIICGKDFDTGAILLHKRLRPVLDHHTLTGMGMCPEHQEKYDEGYIALVGVDPQKSGMFSGSETLKPEDAYRTGDIAHIRSSVWAEVFNSDVPFDKERQVLPMVFVEQQVIEQLAKRTEQADG